MSKSSPPELNNSQGFRWGTLTWVLIIGLAFISVSLSLVSVGESSIQYWYLFLSPLLLAAFRFGLRGALAGSVITLALLIGFYLRAVGSTAPALASLQGLADTATSPSELRTLAFRLADLQSRDPYTNFIRAISGSLLLVFSSGLVGFLFDRTRRQEEEYRAAQQLRRFFAPAVVDAIMHAHHGVGLTSTRKELTVLFADLRGFTRLSEHLEPEELSRLLNEYLSTMTDVIGKYGGTLDKYIGDGIMVFFGDPIPYEDHEERAIRTALEMRERFYELRSRWVMEGRESISIGIGVHSGFMTVGTFGSDTRMEYTVIGSNVNLASRLSDLAEAGQIVTSQRTYFKVRHFVEGRAVGSLAVEGSSHPLEVVSILGYRLVPTAKAGGLPVETGALEQTIVRIVEDASFRAFIISNPTAAFAGLGLNARESSLAQQMASLKGYLLFNNVPAAEIVFLTRLVSVETFRDGVVVTKQGEKEAKFYIIYRGEALVLYTDERGRELHVATLGRGNHFGEVALLYNRPRNATIRSGSELELLTLDQANFETLLRECPVLSQNITEEAQRRLAN